MIDPAEIADVVFHAPKQLVAQVGAGGELGHLDEQEGQLLLSTRETVTLEPMGVCFLCAVFGLDIAKVYPWPPLPSFEIHAHRLAQCAIAIGFDAISHCFEVAEIGVKRGVFLEKFTLFGHPSLHPLDQVRRIALDPLREVVEEFLGGGQVFGGLGVDQDAEVAQARHPRADLVERSDAGGAPREQLFDVALQMNVERDGANRRWDGEQKGHTPQKCAVANDESHIALAPRSPVAHQLCHRRCSRGVATAAASGDRRCACAKRARARIANTTTTV